MSIYDPPTDPTQVWTPEQMAKLHVDTIGRWWPAVTVTATMLAESGGDPLAVHVVTRTPAYLSLDLGMYQINTFWHSVTPRVAFTPPVAWLYVWSLIRTDKSWKVDLSQWTAYNNGAYGEHVSRARDAVNRVLIESGGEPL